MTPGSPPFGNLDPAAWATRHADLGSRTSDMEGSRKKTAAMTAS